MTEKSPVRWHTDNRDCPHSNDDVCPTCDFDRYYANNYPDCPWRTKPLDELRREIESGATSVWCPCWGTPEPDGPWVAPDDLHADIHVLDWAKQNGRL